MDDSDSREQLVLTVRRRGQLLEIDPAFGLLGALRTARTGISSVSDQENSIEATLVPLFDITAPRQGTCAIRCLTGLAPVITELAARAGMVVNDDMAATLSLPMADETWLPKFKFSDWAMINHVRTRDRGLFTIEPSQVHIEQIVRQIVVAWPNAKVLIIETERENAQYLANHLGQYICDVSVMSGRDSRQRPERVTVALPDALGLANIQTCDIIIVTDALTALRPDVSERLVDARNGRLYAFLDRNVRLSPFERDQISALFGLREIPIPRHGMVQMTVEYLQYRVFGGRPVLATATGMRLRRKGIWRHEVRNRKVAKLAALFRTGGGRLLGIFPDLSDGWKLQFPRRVIVLVDNLDHALALADRLPGWPVLAGEDPCLDGLAEPQKALLQASAKMDVTETPMAIVTAMGAERIQLAGVDVVIRADGGVGLPPLPLPGCLEVPYEKNQPLLLVDFDDLYHPQLRKWSRSRWYDYAEAGWIPVGADPEQLAVERFLASRPRKGGK